MGLSQKCPYVINAVDIFGISSAPKINNHNIFEIKRQDHETVGKLTNVLFLKIKNENSSPE